MIIAKSSDGHNDWEFDEAKLNYLLSILNNTIYSDEKKQMYENMMQCGLDQAEYEGLKAKFYSDKIDSIRMKGAGSMTEIKYKLKQLR